MPRRSTSLVSRAWSGGSGNRPCPAIVAGSTRVAVRIRGDLADMCSCRAISSSRRRGTRDLDTDPRRFRTRVAPAYLRRNQEDVLDELPKTVEVDEVLPLSEADERAYRRAVREGSFPAMRQAAMVERNRSHKVERLLEIVEEADAIRAAVRGHLG